jgi:stage II sporulation protein M
VAKFKQALQGYFWDNLALYVTAAAIFCLGLGLGVFSTEILAEAQAHEIRDYLDVFIYGLHSQHYLEPAEIVRASLAQNLKFLFLLWLPGVTMLGLPAAFLVLSLKGFTLGFTLSFLFQQYSVSGLLFALGALIPQNIFIVPALLTAGVACLSFSLLQIHCRIKKKSFQYWPNLGNYTALFALLFLLLLCGSLVEGYITTVFIRLAAGIL